MKRIPKQVIQQALDGRRYITTTRGAWQIFPMPWVSGETRYEVLAPTGKEFVMMYDPKYPTQLPHNPLVYAA